MQTQTFITDPNVRPQNHQFQDIFFSHMLKNDIIDPQYIQSNALMKDVNVLNYVIEILSYQSQKQQNSQKQNQQQSFVTSLVDYALNKYKNTMSFNNKAQKFISIFFYSLIHYTYPTYSQTCQYCKEKIMIKEQDQNEQNNSQSFNCQCCDIDLQESRYISVCKCQELVLCTPCYEYQLNFTFEQGVSVKSRELSLIKQILEQNQPAQQQFYLKIRKLLANFNKQSRESTYTLLDSTELKFDDWSSICCRMFNSKSIAQIGEIIKNFNETQGNSSKFVECQINAIDFLSICLDFNMDQLKSRGDLVQSEHKNLTVEQFQQWLEDGSKEKKGIKNFNQQFKNKYVTHYMLGSLGEYKPLSKDLQNFAKQRSETKKKEKNLNESPQKNTEFYPFVQRFDNQEDFVMESNLTTLSYLNSHRQFSHTNGVNGKNGHSINFDNQVREADLNEREEKIKEEEKNLMIKMHELNEKEKEIEEKQQKIQKEALNQSKKNTRQLNDIEKEKKELINLQEKMSVQKENDLKGEKICDNIGKQELKTFINETKAFYEYLKENVIKKQEESEDSDSDSKLYIDDWVYQKIKDQISKAENSYLKLSEKVEEE